MKMREDGIHRWFPMFFDLEKWRILVVWGGKIAQRRVQTLLEFAPGHIRVVAREMGGAFEKWRGLPNIELSERDFQPEDLAGCQMAIAATDDRELNRRIGEACRERGILVNVASDRSLCDFHFPGVVLKDAVTVGINASGCDHGLAKRTREQIQMFLDQGGRR